MNTSLLPPLECASPIPLQRCARRDDLPTSRWCEPSARLGSNELSTEADRSHQLRFRGPDLTKHQCLPNRPACASKPFQESFRDRRSNPKLPAPGICKPALHEKSRGKLRRPEGPSKLSVLANPSPNRLGSTEDPTNRLSKCLLSACLKAAPERTAPSAFPPRSLPPGFPPRLRLPLGTVASLYRHLLETKKKMTPFRLHRGCAAGGSEGNVHLPAKTLDDLTARPQWLSTICEKWSMGLDHFNFPEHCV